MYRNIFIGDNNQEIYMHTVWKGAISGLKGDIGEKEVEIVVFHGNDTQSD